MKNESRKRNIFIKIIYRKLFLGNTVANLEGWLNVENLMYISFR
jgi:hypothetical protein